jgi:exopolyphosphatase / guanosine-5'-triphosphate,3'-diphosphate pyrophosphatase
MSAVAAVDIGTNSTNLLVVDSSGTEIDRVVAITRLGEGVHHTRRLGDGPMERTLAQLAEHRSLLDRHGVTRVRAVATSATRDAVNGAEFLDRAEAVLGVRPELLSGQDEGRLAFLGATAGLESVDARPPYLVVDIGGGSTELMLGGDTVERVVSIDIGAVRLTELELHADPPQPEELTNAIGRVQDLLDDAVRAMFPDDVGRGYTELEAATLVGIAGTITTVAAVEIGLPRYDPAVLHGFRLSRPAAEDVFRTLATETLADRVYNPGLPEARADVIVGGCCVLVGIMRRLQSDALVVSDHNLLHGVCAELLR